VGVDLGKRLADDARHAALAMRAAASSTAS
jgi:hypothetical protein